MDRRCVDFATASERAPPSIAGTDVRRAAIWRTYTHRGKQRWVGCREAADGFLAAEAKRPASTTAAAAASTSAHALRLGSGGWE